VVFLHAGIADRRSFDGVLDLLSPDMDVSAYDRRGFGTTTYRPEWHDQIADLDAVLDGLGLGQVALVGNSRGGQIALDAALAHPGRIAALVLVAPAISGAPPTDDSEIEPQTAAIWADLEAAESAGALDALNLGELRLWLDGPTAEEGRVTGALRTLALDMNRIALHADDPGCEPEPPPTSDRLTELSCPVLVVVGDLDLAHLQARCRWLADTIPGAELAVMKGAAHLPAFEKPDEFAAVLRNFLNH
jgi:pimeloyl-ACP methyl ester carboxylesterase